MKKYTLFLAIILFILVSAVYYLFFTSDKEFVQEDMYEQILGRGKIRVGINLNSKPFGYIDKNNNVAGYDADLARFVADYILHNPNRVEFVPVTPANRLIKASTGEVDMVISTVTITRQRQEVVAFSIPYSVAGQALLVRRNSEITSMSDLAGKRAGVIFGTTAEKNMQKNVPNARVIGFRTYPEAYKALISNQIDAITSDDTILSRFAEDDKNVVLLPKRYSREPYGIAFKKGKSSDKLKEKLDEAIKVYKRRNFKM